MKNKNTKSRLRARQRNKDRRKLKHNRQIATRMKNEYAEYLKKMNNFEYHTWVSQVTESECKTKDIKTDILLKQYDFISKADIKDDVTNNSRESCCIS